MTDATDHATTVPGVHVTPSGLVATVRSTTASAVELCLEEPGGRERRIGLERDGDYWRAAVTGIEPGRRYGLRAHGPYDPTRGDRFDPARLLLDPFARAIDGAWGVVLEPGRRPRSDRPLRPWAETVIYELHVRGFTRLHPGVPPALRGTYAGLAHPAAIAELTSLGVTAVELLPVAEFRSERHLREAGRRNYWGYSPVGFCAPHADYAASGSRGSQGAEFRAMVDALHDAGIEVILDVVYNHTAEGGPDEPALSLRGLDNRSYYRLDGDVTGTGNTLDASLPAVQELVLTSLRTWVEQYGVDGFRFDLAVTLGRGPDGFSADSPLLTGIAADPLLQTVKLIAEPWDIGPGGYRVGGFAAPFAEWNGVYRDSIREFWRGRGPTSELARALAGSSDVFAACGRGPLASVNFVTSHDGFTLRDLVSYDVKHNLGNGEVNRDGDNHNRSWNSGYEGETDDPAIGDLRERRTRAILATLLVSAGVPMLLAGDERGRTQGGNNNGYCTDTPLTWVDWSDDRHGSLVRRVIALRAAEPALRRESFFTGEPGPGGALDIRWLTHDGQTMDATWWQAADAPTLGALLDGRLLVIAHAHDDPTTFDLPGAFEILLDTAAPDRTGRLDGVATVGAWSVLILRVSAGSV